MDYTVRLAYCRDVPAITEIYNQGIAEQDATLETRLRTVEEMEGWLAGRSERHSVLVLEDASGAVLGWASLNVFNPRECFGGVADISIYMHWEARGKGLGKILNGELIRVARNNGFHKLVLYTFNTNQAAKALYRSMGFREVGVYKQHSMKNGDWVDSAIYELLL